ncbi:hypothetical protein AVEN_228403-1 [Araneus ventricosus]|uniref:Uncharacterized protein n=1 Tax=Araneus ventricosus TaxID=182803 RepID=A0A4Y2V9H7_ARAVE|nr:hypothetical protein AVEN_228403-1 [Araneus ventricosus]
MDAWLFSKFINQMSKMFSEEKQCSIPMPTTGICLFYPLVALPALEVYEATGTVHTDTGTLSPVGGELMFNFYRSVVQEISLRNLDLAVCLR